MTKITWGSYTPNHALFSTVSNFSRGTHDQSCQLHFKGSVIKKHQTGMLTRPGVDHTTKVKVKVKVGVVSNKRATIMMR